MTTALAPGMSPERLVPGDPDGARALAARLESYAEGASAATARLRSLESGTWVGEAAEAFRSSLEELPQSLERASGSFAEAASALRSYAAVAEEARERAAQALARFEEAETSSARSESERAGHEAALAAEADGGPPAGAAPASRDPGASGRTSAERLVDDARDELEAAERAVEARLRRAGDDAPDKPGFWDDTWRIGKDFVGGAAEATAGLAEFVFKATPVYALVDRDGFVESFNAMRDGLAYGWNHPVEFAKAAVNWELWQENPARAAGQMVPDLALAVGTAGTGAAASAAARAGRTTKRLGDAADAARAGDRLAGAGDVRRTHPDRIEVPGAALKTPKVESPKLQNIVDDLYKGSTNPGRVGTGTTADAIRFELRTGQQVYGRSHIQKGRDYLRGLENWLKANPDAPYRDRLVARSLADDLVDALQGAP